MTRRRLWMQTVFVCSMLVIPAIAMNLSEEVKWGIGDFFIAAVMLSLLAFSVDHIYHINNRPTYSAVLITLSVMIFLLIWVHLAVVIF